MHGEFNVSIVPDGEEALRELRNPTSHTFDLILLDITLPGIDGFDVARVIRKMPMHYNTPILFFTMKSGDDVVEQVRKAGGMGLWEKPDYRNVDQLRKTVRDCLKLQPVEKFVEFYKGPDHLT